MISREKQDLIKNWWEFGEQEEPLIIAAKCENIPPKPEDLTAYWEDNRLRFDLFERQTALTEFLGVAVPFCYVDFGSSCMAGNLGCPMRYINHETIWPRKLLNRIEEIPDASIQEGSPWYRRVYDYLSLSLNRKDIVTACYALGGIGDTIGSLYGEETLLTDMLDKPEDVKKAFRHIKHIWIQEYEKQVSLIKQSGQTGMCGWSGVWAPGGAFPVQEDMSYMLSPELFNQFCLPELMDIFEVIEYPMYHLDGKMAIFHLDSLLRIKKLKAVQWVPGAGNEEIAQWYPLLKRILDAGKSIQIYATAQEVGDIVRNLGTRGVLVSLSFSCG